MRKVYVRIACEIYTDFVLEHLVQDNRRYLLQEIKVPVAYFIGGPKDMGYTTVSSPLFMTKTLYTDHSVSPRRIMPCSMLAYRS